MNRSIFLLYSLVSVLLYSCADLEAKRITTAEDNTVINWDTLADVPDYAYLDEVDEYVNYIRQNSEEMTITKQEIDNENAVLFVQNGDTVKISVLGGSDNTSGTDIYFQDSKPVFMNRNVILDVDSSYMETAYLRRGKIYKYFRNGSEIKDLSRISKVESVLCRKIFSL